MTTTATNTYLVGVIERAISYFEVEAEDARTAVDNWQEGEFRDRDDEALEPEGPCNVREKQPDGTFLMLPKSQWEAAFDDAGSRSPNTADAASLLLDLIRYGLLSLEDGDAYCEFTSTIYWYDHSSPNWQALVDAIGWDDAAAAILKGTAR